MNVVQMAIPSNQTVPVLYLILIMTFVPTISTEEYICGVPDTRNPTVIAHDLRPAMAAFQSPLLGELMGYVEDVKKVAQVCADKCKEAGAKTIVVLDESDAAFMKHQWAEWQLFDGAVTTATAFLADAIEKGSLKPGKVELRACYHDPAKIAREIEETEPARKIMAAMGIDLHELYRSRKTTKSCGGTLLPLTNPKMTAMVADGRLGDIRFAGENAVITSTPTAFDNFSMVEQDDIKIEDLFVMLDSVC